MDFHPQKCSVLWVSRAKTPMTFQYKLKGTTLMEEKATKYLGVDLQASLSWNHHINRVKRKANSILKFLRCNLRYASKETKTQAQVKPGLLLYHLESLPSGPETPSGDRPARGSTFCDKQVQKHEHRNRHVRRPGGKRMKPEEQNCN